MGAQMEEVELTSGEKRQKIRIYLTHFSAKKDDSLRGTGKKVKGLVPPSMRGKLGQWLDMVVSMPIKTVNATLEQ